MCAGVARGGTAAPELSLWNLPRTRRAFISYFNKAPPSFRDKQHYACMRARAVAERKWFYNKYTSVCRAHLSAEKFSDPIRSVTCAPLPIYVCWWWCMRERKSVRKGLQAERHVFFFSEWFLVSYPGREGYTPFCQIKRVKYSVAVSCLLTFPYVLFPPELWNSLVISEAKSCDIVLFN